MQLLQEEFLNLSCSVYHNTLIPSDEGESRTGPPITPGELQSLLKDGSLLSVSRMNKDGGWEKVVALDSDLDNRNSSRGSYINSEDMSKRLNWAKQLQPDEEV